MEHGHARPLSPGGLSPSFPPLLRELHVRLPCPSRDALPELGLAWMKTLALLKAEKRFLDPTPFLLDEEKHEPVPRVSRVQQKREFVLLPFYSTACGNLAGGRGEGSTR